MAALSITAANVLASATALRGTGIAGATITAGQPIYKDASDSNKAKLADNNASAATSACVGISLQSVSAGQPITYVYEDSSFTVGATLTVGAIYCLGATAGEIVPVADLASGNYPVVLLVANTTTTATLKIVRGTAVIPA
jgi:hypothetical protein